MIANTPRTKTVGIDPFIRSTRRLSNANAAGLVRAISMVAKCWRFHPGRMEGGVDGGRNGRLDGGWSLEMDGWVDGAMDG